MKKIFSRNEILFLLITSLVFIIITTLPLVYGFLIQNESVYLGLNHLSPADTLVYYSYIGQIKEGHFLLDNLYTSEGSQMALFNPLWLIIGLTAKFFDLSPFIAYQAFRILLIPVLLAILYRVVGYFLGEVSSRTKKVALIFMILASGWGGLASRFFPQNFAPEKVGYMMDSYVAEAVNFLILFYSPHFLASLSLLILTFYFFIRSVENKSSRQAIYSGLCALGLFSFHPFFVVTVYILPLIFLSLYFIIKRQLDFSSIKNYCLLVIFSMPAAIYYGVSVVTNELLKQKAVQNNCLSPSFYIFLISFGLVSILAVAGSFKLILAKPSKLKNLFLLVWFWGGLGLIYSPLNFQRRLSEGWQIPAGILAFIALISLGNYFKNRFIGQAFLKYKKITLVGAGLAFFILFAFSNYIFYVDNLTFLRTKPLIVYITPQFNEAAKWYQQQVGTDSLILSSNLSGYLLPGLSFRRVYLGHLVETVNYQQKIRQMAWFYRDNQNDQEKIKFLGENQIDYIFSSPLEKLFGNFDPKTKTYLQEVYYNQGVGIYQVNLK